MTAGERSGTTRRQFVLELAGVTLAGCGIAESDPGKPGASASADSGTCVLYPQETQGPFYLNLDLLRSDIREGKPGTELELDLRILRLGDCAPLASVAVDVWHCDASGVYGGFPGQLGGLDTTGQTFLRGTQVTDAEGHVVFRTIYPGWYPGRTTHIHFKVHVTATREAISQLYFPEDVTQAVYQAPPYDAHGQKDTSNAVDATAHTGGFPPLLTIGKDAAGVYHGTVTIIVAQ